MSKLGNRNTSSCVQIDTIWRCTVIQYGDAQHDTIWSCTVGRLAHTKQQNKMGLIREVGRRRGGQGLAISSNKRCTLFFAGICRSLDTGLADKTARNAVGFQRARRATRRTCTGHKRYWVSEMTCAHTYIDATR